MAIPNSKRKVTFNAHVTEHLELPHRSSSDLVTQGERKPLLPKQSQSLPNLKTKDSTPAPNHYQYDVWNMYKGTSTTFNSRRLDIFQTRRDFSEATPDIRYMKLKRHYKPLSHYLSPIDPKAKGVTLKGDRKTLFTDAKKVNALFLFPRLVDRTPGPGAYNIPNTIGVNNLHILAKQKKEHTRAKLAALSNPSLSAKYSTQRKNNDNYVYYFRQPGPTLKGRGSTNLQQINRSGDVYLIKEMKHETPAPGAYDIASSVGTGITFGPPRDQYDRLPDIPITNNEIQTERKEKKPKKKPTTDMQVSKSLAHYPRLPDIGLGEQYQIGQPRTDSEDILSY